MKIENSEIIQNLGKIDLFICASGFESRSISLASMLSADIVYNAYAFSQQENYTLSEQNLNKINDIFPNLNVIEYPKNKPYDTFEIFINSIDTYIQQSVLSTKLQILLDITAFTRETLLILIRVLSMPDIVNKVNVKIVYKPAYKYQEDWLTKGVREIRPILGYSGLITPSKQSLLVILTGFEDERMRTVIDIFEPTRILLGKPCEKSSINKNLFAISETKSNELSSEYKHLLIDDRFTFSCQDINETKNAILSIYDKYSNDFNIIIAPLNNKISTLGVAFAALKEEGIQICYPSANQYNIDNYSTPSDFFLLYNLSDYI